MIRLTFEPNDKSLSTNLHSLSTSTLEVEFIIELKAHVHGTKTHVSKDVWVGVENTLMWKEQKDVCSIPLESVLFIIAHIEEK